MTTHKEDYSWIHIGLAILIGGVILYLLFFSSGSDYVKIKYRDDKVNISASNFESLNKSDSTVKGAWYDKAQEYMVIKLGSTYYHYCEMPSVAWNDFRSSNHPYDHYEDRIRGDYDCRIYRVPRY
ncbi:MAG: KTSC domain-containing protein [Candidatus Saccharibacteria bacterium]|nr:KTSC domain-containing protein [Candidatus Saccharibacteria bacterium]